MKKITALIVLISGSLCLFGQTYIATYQKNEIPKKEKDQEFDKYFSKEDLKKFEEFSTRPHFYTLTYSEGKSLYQNAPKTTSKEDDTFEMGGSEGGMSIKIVSSTFNEIPEIGFKDFDKNKMFTQSSIFEKGFNVEEELTPLNWEITDEHKEIGNVKCTVAKAILPKNSWRKEDQEVKACYDESLPIPDGPDEYYGLPGLIVEIESPTHKIILTELKIVKENSALEAPKNNYKTLTRAEFEKTLKRKMNSINNN